MLPLACDCDVEPSCIVCSCEKESERITPSPGQEEPWQLCPILRKQSLSGTHMVTCLWFVPVYLLCTTFLFTYLTTFHLHCLHYLTDYNKGDVLLTFWEHLRPEVEGRRLLNLIHVYCNNNCFSCFFNDISLSHHCQGTPKKLSLKYMFYSEWTLKVLVPFLVSFLSVLCNSKKLILENMGGLFEDNALL